jgi:hypothetical protein
MAERERLQGMKFTPEYEAMLFRRPLSDDDRFERWTGHLPKRRDSTPYHSEAHSIRAMELVYKICNKPVRVFEIGFCLGHSASIWLELGVTEVVSADNSLRDQTIQAGEIMRNKWGKRFSLLAVDQTPKNTNFGMAFIDGSHEFGDVSRDIETALLMKIPWIVCDDIGDKWGPGVEPAIHARGLIIEAIVGNLAVCRKPQS